MVVKSKSSIPSVNPEHPAFQLTIIDNEKAQQLAKLSPTYLTNDQIPDNHSIHKIRNTYEYIYVMHWLNLCRGFIKLESEYFDVDLFEIELLNMVYPAPLNDSVLFIHKLKKHLINALPGKPTDTFENVYDQWFNQANTKAKEEDLDTMEVDNIQDSELPLFDNMLFEDKIHWLYNWMIYLTDLPQFRSFLDKKSTLSENLRMNCIWQDTNSGSTSEQWLFLFNSRLYKRIVRTPELSIPKKRKLAPQDPQAHYGDAKFDVEDIQFELLAKGIYQIDSLITELNSRKKAKIPKEQYKALTYPQIIDDLFTSELKKRKILTSRKKEVQMSNLLATRKRSSRIEALERQRQLELQREKEQKEEEERILAAKRTERRMASRQHDAQITGLTREDRARLRRAEETPETSISDMNSQKSEVSTSNPEDEQNPLKQTSTHTPDTKTESEIPSCSQLSDGKSNEQSNEPSLKLEDSNSDIETRPENVKDSPETTTNATVNTEEPSIPSNASKDAQENYSKHGMNPENDSNASMDTEKVQASSQN